MLEAHPQTIPGLALIANTEPQSLANQVRRLASLGWLRVVGYDGGGGRRPAAVYATGAAGKTLLKQFRAAISASGTTWDQAACYATFRQAYPLVNLPMLAYLEAIIGGHQASDIRQTLRCEAAYIHPIINRLIEHGLVVRRSKRSRLEVVQKGCKLIKLASHL